MQVMVRGWGAMVIFMAVYFIYFVFYFILFIYVHIFSLFIFLLIVMMKTMEHTVISSALAYFTFCMYIPNK